MLTTDRSDLTVILLPGEEHRRSEVRELYGSAVDVRDATGTAGVSGRFVQFLGAGDTPLPRGVDALVAALRASESDAALGRTLLRSPNGITLASAQSDEVGTARTAATLSDAAELAAARDLGAWVFRTEFLQAPGTASDLLAVVSGEQGIGAAPQLALLAHVAANARVDIVPSPVLQHRTPARAGDQDVDADLADLATYLRSELAARAVLGAPTDSPAHQAWTRSVVRHWLPSRIRLLLADGRPLPDRMDPETADLALDLADALSPAVLAPTSAEQALVALLAAGHLASAARWSEPVLTSREAPHRESSEPSLVAGARAVAARLGRSPLVHRLVMLAAEDLRADVRAHGAPALTPQRAGELMEVDRLVPPDAAGVRGLGDVEGFVRAVLCADTSGALLRSLAPEEFRLTRVRRLGTSWVLRGTTVHRLAGMELWVSLGKRRPSSGTAFVRIEEPRSRASWRDARTGVRWSAVLPTGLPARGTLLLCAADTPETLTVRAETSAACHALGNQVAVEPDGRALVQVGNGPLVRVARRAARRAARLVG